MASPSAIGLNHAQWWVLVSASLTPFLTTLLFFASIERFMATLLHAIQWRGNSQCKDLYTLLCFKWLFLILSSQVVSMKIRSYFIFIIITYFYWEWGQSFSIKVFS